MLSRLRAIGDGLAFASLIPAGVAATLLLAAGAAMGSTPDWIAASLAAAGTLVVYNVDRLRDTGMDRLRAPLRTEFVDRHRRGLWLLTAAAALVAAALARQTPREVVLLCAAVLAVGLLHRRLKRWPHGKPLYIAGAWLAVTVGIPALSAKPSAEGLGTVAWVLAVHGAAISANLLATGLRERGSDAAPGRLAGARAMALVGLLVALVGPEAVRHLAAIPASELIALVLFRPGERYLLTALDGALLVGAAASLVWT